MSNTNAASGDPRARLLLQMKEIVAVLRAEGSDHILLVDRLPHNSTELNPDLRRQFPRSMEGLYKFCAFDSVSIRKINFDNDGTRDERFSMDDARRAAEKVIIMWPNIQDVTAERVYALKKMIDADIEANPEPSREKLENYLIDVIMSEGMYRISEAEREKPIDELSDTEKQDLIRNVVGTAKRVKRIIVHNTASSSVTKSINNATVNAGLVIRLLTVIKECLQNVVDNTNAMVKVVKEFHNVSAFEALTHAELQEKLANFVTIEGFKLLFFELLRRQVLKLNEYYEKHSSEPIGDLVKILDSVELEEMSELDGVSDLRSEGGESEMDHTLDE